MSEHQLANRQRIKLWWRYIGAPRAYGIALLSIYLTIISLLILIAITLIR